MFSSGILFYNYPILLHPVLSSAMNYFNNVIESRSLEEMSNLISEETSPAIDRPTASVRDETYVSLHSLDDASDLLSPKNVSAFSNTYLTKYMSSQGYDGSYFDSQKQLSPCNQSILFSDFQVPLLDHESLTRPQNDTKPSCLKTFWQNEEEYLKQAELDILYQRAMISHLHAVQMCRQSRAALEHFSKVDPQVKGRHQEENPSHVERYYTLNPSVAETSQQNLDPMHSLSLSSNTNYNLEEGWSLFSMENLDQNVMCLDGDTEETEEMVRLLLEKDINENKKDEHFLYSS